MSKKRAIEICRNLTQTIEKMSPNIYIEHVNETFELPRARKNVLKKIRKKLTKKYNLK